MTRRTHARLARFTLLFYVAAGITFSVAAGISNMVLSSRAASAEGLAARLQAISQHATEAGLVVILGLGQSFFALVLAATLWAIAHATDPGLAMLALACRVAESVSGAAGLSATCWLLLMGVA